MNFELNYIAIADINSISGIVRAYKAIKESQSEFKASFKRKSTKLIPGVTLEKDHEFKITCLAKKKNGSKNHDVTNKYSKAM